MQKKRPKGNMENTIRPRLKNVPSNISTTSSKPPPSNAKKLISGDGHNQIDALGEHPAIRGVYELAHSGCSPWTPAVFFPSFIFYVNFDSLRNRITITVGIHSFLTIFIFINAVYYQLLKGIGSEFIWLVEKLLQGQCHNICSCFSA